MTTLKYVNEAVPKKGVRKVSLEAESPSARLGEALSLRRVRSDSLTPTVHTYTPSSLKDEKDRSPNIRMKFDLYDSTQLLGGNLATGKKKSSKQRQRRASIQKGVALDVVALQKLKKKQEEEDKESIFGSETSFRTSPSGDLSQNGASEQFRLSPSLTISHSPDDGDDDPGTIEDGSDTSSIYHSSCMYQPEEQPKTVGNLLEDPRKVRDYRRRKSSPVVNNTSRSRRGKLAEFPDGERCHSSQDVPNLLSLNATLPSKPKYYSTQEDLSSIAPQRKDSQTLPTKEDVTPTPIKEHRGSTDSQAQQRKRKEGGKNPPDQNCQSYFGIMLSALCFLLFLWYLGMASSKFIKSALSFDTYDEMNPPDLGVVQEVVVYIAVEELLEADT